MKVAYVRVSTVEQNEDRQLEALEKYGIEKWFTEKISGKNTDRPQLKAMLEFIREGDTVYVHDFSRLARSTRDLLDIVEQLKVKNVNLVSNKESLDTSTANGRFMLTVIAAMYEFERTNMLERQREGIAIKKDQDKHLPPEQRTYKGRKAVSISKEIFSEQYERYMNREINKGELAKALNVSRPTLDKLIKEHTESRS